MIIYDIRQQSSPKEIVLIMFGIVMLFAALLFAMRIIKYFNGTLAMDKIEAVLNILGVVCSIAIAIVLISLDVNTITDFKKYTEQVTQGTCSSVTGTLENAEVYNIRALDEDLLKFEVNGTYFDTYNLYRTDNIGLKSKDIYLLENAKSVTIKYVETDSFMDDETSNWILSIEIIEM